MHLYSQLVSLLFMGEGYPVNGESMFWLSINGFRGTLQFDFNVAEISSLSLVPCFMREVISALDQCDSSAM